MNKILVIQTAFIGDVILATAILESLREKHPHAKIDFLVRKGNEGLVQNHPFINEVLVWDKKNKKYKALHEILKKVRKHQYDLLINLQRFGASGYLTWRSRAKIKAGFQKNPFSFCFDVKAQHEIGNGTHEVDRNFGVLQKLGGYQKFQPKLYPTKTDFEKVKALIGGKSTVVLAPSSVWFTKQLPAEKWLELIIQYAHSHQIVMIGAASDKDYLDSLIYKAETHDILNCAGQLSLLESAALISLAKMTHVNDSAPLHLASAMNAAVTAYFCSTVPAFGFGPLSENNRIVEISQSLDCRPCGLHGKKVCPKGHFKCGLGIDVTLS